MSATLRQQADALRETFLKGADKEQICDMCGGSRHHTRLVWRHGRTSRAFVCIACFIGNNTFEIADGGLPA